MDWFEKLTGFREQTGAAGCAATRQRLQFVGQQVQGLPARRCAAVGRLELVSLAELRARAGQSTPVAGPAGLQIVRGQAGELARRAAPAPAHTRYADSPFPHHHPTLKPP